MRSDHILGMSARGFHRIHYCEWGDPVAERVVICVHGLTRNCRDFDALAAALAPHFRVVCPDVAGRGRSDWLADKSAYNFHQYLSDMNALIARATSRPAAPRSIYWVGTSMGGILGMLLAALPHTPIAKLVVNDVGPRIPKTALARIAAYVGKDARCASLAELEAYVRMVSASFGPLTDEQWRYLTLHGSKQHADGSWGMRYDPGIAIGLSAALISDVDLWTQWDAIACPTLALRGAQSDLLLAETAQAMQGRGPRAHLVEFPDIGHAPMLMADDQISVIKDFLLGA